MALRLGEVEHRPAARRLHRRHHVAELLDVRAGIAYRLDLYIKKGARAKEGLLDRLVNTPSPFWFLRTVLAPRFAQLAIHRRQEFSRILRAKLTAT